MKTSELLGPPGEPIYSKEELTRRVRELTSILDCLQEFLGIELRWQATTTGTRAIIDSRSRGWHNGKYIALQAARDEAGFL